MFERIVFFLVILLLPTQLGLHFWPPFAYIFSLKIDYLSPTIYLWDLLCISLVMLWLYKKFLSRDFSHIPNLSIILLLAYLLSQIISLFGAINLGAGLFRLEQLFVTGLFGVYISSQKLKNIKYPLYLGFIISLLFEALLGVAQFIKAGSIGFWIFGERTFSLSTPSIAKFTFFNEVFLRPYGTFPHPNVLAAFLIISASLLFYLYEGLKKHGFVFRFSILLGIVATFLTFSRSAIFLSLIQGVLFLKPQIKKYYILVLIIVLPLILIRFGSTFSFDNLSFLRREELAQISLNQFIENPITGVGLNNFINYFSQSSSISGMSRFLQPVHNIFLLTLAETGVIGFLGLMLLCLFPVFKLFGTRKDLFSKNLLFTWGAIFFLGSFDHYFLTLPQGLRMVFLIWGLSMLKR